MKGFRRPGPLLFPAYFSLELTELHLSADLGSPVGWQQSHGAADTRRHGGELSIPISRVQVQQKYCSKAVSRSSACVLQALVDGAAETQMAAFLVLLRAKASP